MTDVHNAKRGPETFAVILFITAGLLVLLNYLLPVFVSVIISLQAYRHNSGIFDGPWTGLENYRMVFQYREIGRVIRSTFMMGALGGVLPVLPGYLTGRAAAACKPKTSWAWTGALLLPAFFPGDFLVRLINFLFGAEVLNGLQGYVVWLWYGLLAGMRTCAYTSFLAAFLGRIAVRRGRTAADGAKLGAAVALGIGLILLLSPDKELCKAMYTSKNYVTTDILSTVSVFAGGDLYIIRDGAVWVMRMLLSLPGIAAGTALLLRTDQELGQWGEKPDEPVLTQEPGSGAIFWGMGAILAAGAVLAVLPVLFPSAGAELPETLISSTAVITLYSLLINLMMLLTGGYLIKRRRTGVLLCLLLPLADNVYGQYPLIRGLALYITRLAPSLFSINLTAVIAIGFLIVSMGHKPPSWKSWKKEALPLLFLFGGMAAVQSWSGVGAQVYYLSDYRNYGLGLIWREFSLNTRSMPLELHLLTLALWTVLPMALMMGAAVLIFGRLMDRRK